MVKNFLGIVRNALFPFILSSPVTPSNILIFPSRDIFLTRIYRKLIGIFDLKLYMDYDSEFFFFVLQVFPIGISNTQILYTQIYLF